MRYIISRLFALLFYFFFTIQLSVAQQDAQLSQFFFNQLYYNPAYSGVNADYTELTALHRSQWAGYESSFDDGGEPPTTQVFSVNAPLRKYNLGGGLHVVNDRIGLLRSTEVQLSLAYHIPTEIGTFSLGLRSGLYNFRTDESNVWRPVDAGDPVIDELDGGISESSGDFAVGAYFITDDQKYFGGISMNRLQQSSFGQSVTVNELTQHIYVNGGANFSVSASLDVSPLLLLKSDLNTYSLEGGIMSTYQEKVMFGLSMRELDAFIATAGLFLDNEKKLRLSYAFDYVLTQRNVKESTSHEIMLSYRLPAIKFYEPAPIRSPRFRFDR